MGPRGFDPSALVHMGDSEAMAPLARAADPGFAFVPITSHYDGVYYYAIARDPFARGPAHTLIDLPAYRYDHPGFGWLAGIASLGRASFVPAAMLAVALACFTIAAAAASVLAGEMGLSRWWGLALALNPGVVYSVTVVTSEAAGLAAVLLAIVAWRRGRRWPGVAAMTAACLIKEQYVIVPVAIAFIELVRWLRDRPMPAGAFVRRVAPLAIAPIVYAGWFAYVLSRFADSPFHEAKDFTSTPFTGWVRTFDIAAAYGGGDFSSAQVGAITIPLLVVVGCALAVGALYALRVDSEVQAIFLPLAVLAFTFNYYELLFPKDLVRTLAVQLALLPYVFAPQRRQTGV
jgi:hypothetical protein